MKKRIFTMSRDEVEHNMALHEKAVGSGRLVTDMMHEIIIKMLRENGIPYNEGDPPETWEALGFKFIEIQIEGKPESPANGIYLMKHYATGWKPVSCVTTAFIDNLGNANITYYEFEADEALDFSVFSV